MPSSYSAYSSLVLKPFAVIIDVQIQVVNVNSFNTFELFKCIFIDGRFVVLNFIYIWEVNGSSLLSIYDNLFF